MKDQMPAGAPVMPSSARFSWSRIAIATAATILAGCSSQDPIVVERVPKDAPPAPREEAPAARNDRMLASIIPGGDSALFFKLTGPEQSVSRQKAAFLELVESVTFEGERPRWSLPSGWTEEPGSGERLATIIVPGDPPLQGTVTSLPFRGDEAEYRLANVNRWRGQMGLSPIGAADLHAGGDLDEETVELPLADGTKATIVNLAGRLEAGGMIPPFAGGASGMPQSAARSSPRSGLSYDVPQGWTEAGGGGISAASFEASDGVKITITPLSAGANPILPNLNRWRGQIGLPQIEELQVGEATRTVTLGDGEEGRLVDLIGPRDGERQQAITGVIAYRDDLAWFVKMSGDADPVRREKQNFERFVKSLRFSEGQD